MLYLTYNVYSSQELAYHPGFKALICSPSHTKRTIDYKTIKDVLKIDTTNNVISKAVTMLSKKKTGILILYYII